MALSLRTITSWQIQKEKVEAVTCVILGGFKFTANGDWGLEIQTCLLLGRQAMTKHVKKQRQHFTRKHLYSQSYGLSRSHV